MAQRHRVFRPTPPWRVVSTPLPFGNPTPGRALKGLRDAQEDRR
ncbi:MULTISPECIES: hypothetical protein [unclassified Marinovum]